MRKKSVAVQGLSVLERLLYDTDQRASLLTKGAGGKRRCAAGAAIAGNLETIAREIVEAWPAVKEKINAEGSTAPREAVTRFATDLLTIYQVVGDLKLDAPMGKTAAEAKPKSAQWWRSGLSSQTARSNEYHADAFARGIIRQQRLQLRRDIKGDVASFVRIAHVSRVAMAELTEKAQHADELAARAMVIG